MIRMTRVGKGKYRIGYITVEDTYSPSGAPHTRSVTLTRDRWLVTYPSGLVKRFDRLKDARSYVEGR